MKEPTKLFVVLTAPGPTQEFIELEDGEGTSVGGINLERYPAELRNGPMELWRMGPFIDAEEWDSWSEVERTAFEWAAEIDRSTKVGGMDAEYQDQLAALAGHALFAAIKANLRHAFHGDPGDGLGCSVCREHPDHWIHGSDGLGSVDLDPVVEASDTREA